MYHRGLFPCGAGVVDEAVSVTRRLEQLHGSVGFGATSASTAATTARAISNSRTTSTIKMSSNNTSSATTAAAAAAAATIAVTTAAITAAITTSDQAVATQRHLEQLAFDISETVFCGVWRLRRPTTHLQLLEMSHRSARALDSLAVRKGICTRRNGNQHLKEPT